jgi:serine/threonine protein kinase
MESADGHHFITMEFIQGETLASRLHRGRVATTDALEICRQVAAALEAAHNQGVVHRDVKPANIMISLDGLVKVLDFGVAKMLTPAYDGSKSSEGGPDSVLAGTPEYMSPEQLLSRRADHRSDIWALGCVLYECLTGQRVVDADFLARGVGSWTPDWRRLPEDAAEGVRSILARSLKIDPNERASSMSDIRASIEAITAALPGPAPSGS